MTKMADKILLFADKNNYRLHKSPTSLLNESAPNLDNFTTLNEFKQSAANEDNNNATLNDLTTDDIFTEHSEMSQTELTATRNANYDNLKNISPRNNPDEHKTESLHKIDMSITDNIKSSTTDTEMNNNLFEESSIENDSYASTELIKNKVLNKNKSPNDTEKEIRSVNLSSQCCFIPHGISSEVLIRETELELNKLQSLTSKSNHQVNQAIYKLAYDESLTDQSETEDVELTSESADQEPCCSTSQESRSEILVHEADSASDAGSEDVELLPHRCAINNAQINSKHIYVNNLSLAVELLRTKENLPYDSEFRMICDEEQNKNKFPQGNFREQSENAFKSGTVNVGYVQDRCDGALTNEQIESQPRSNMLDKQTNNTTQKDYKITPCNLQASDEVGEEAREAARFLQDPVLNIDENKNRPLGGTVSSNYQRLGNRARQQFNLPTSRSSIINPCFCCTIM